MTDVATASGAGIRAKRTRIAGIDVARGIALIGMAATHMLPTSTGGQLTAVGWLFAGKASALFAVLAGVSLAIVSGGTTPFVGADRRRARITIAVRAALIGVLGLVLAAAETPVAVILAYYAVFFLLTLPFLGLRARTLALLAAGWALVSPQLSYVIRGHLPDAPRDQVDIGMLVTDPLTALHALVFTGYYPAFTWLTYLLAGLAVGRIDLRGTRVAAWLAGLGALLAAGSWIVSSLLLDATGATAVIRTESGPVRLVGHELNQIEWYGTTNAGEPQWLLVAGAHSGTTFDLVHTIGTALLVLGVCLLLARGIGVRITRPLAAVGSMTLTLYTLHVLSLAGPIDWPAPGWYAAQVLIALVAAPLWLMRFRRGPLEELVHDISTTAGLQMVPRSLPPPG
ncbi:MAG: heparan-alpha-glucosaminide N-acetyltransferase domain-containing protein [Candidatus Nanopelagicales bacterium]